MIFFFPPYALFTAASNTRTEAHQMSGPVPSPSMKGMIGSSGTDRRPLDIVIELPLPAMISSVGDGEVHYCPRRHERRRAASNYEHRWVKLNGWKNRCRGGGVRPEKQELKEAADSDYTCDSIDN